MRLLIRPPATVARVLGAYAVVPAEVDEDGWYVASPGTLYYVRDIEGRASHVVYGPAGETRMINPMRAELWAALLDVGATHEEAEKLSASY